MGSHPDNPSIQSERDFRSSCPWRAILPTWPDEWRERWGKRANEKQAGGVHWIPAEAEAFGKTWDEAEAAGVVLNLEIIGGPRR